MRAAIYLRVSTADQTTDNQQLALEAVAKLRGWTVVAIYTDRGISGAKARDKRPQFDLMLKDAQRGKLDLVMAWGLDRLGRSLPDLVATMEHLKACGVGLYLDKQDIDTTTPAGKALLGMAMVFAEFEREMIRERTLAGLERARKAGKQLGRPPRAPATKRQALALLEAGQSIREAAKATGLSPSTVARLK